MNSDNEHTAAPKPKSLEFTALLILVYGLWSPVKSLTLTVMERMQALPDLPGTQQNDIFHYINLGLGVIFIIISYGIFTGRNLARIFFYAAGPVLMALDFYLFGFQYTFLIKPALYIIFVIVLNNKEFVTYFKNKR